MTKPPSRRDIAKQVPKGALLLLSIMQERANARGYVRINREHVDQMREEMGGADSRVVRGWLEALERHGAIARSGPPASRVARITVQGWKTTAAKLCCGNGCGRPVHAMKGRPVGDLCSSCRQEFKPELAWRSLAVDRFLDGASLVAIVKACQAAGHIHVSLMGTGGMADGKAQDRNRRRVDRVGIADGVLPYLVSVNMLPREFLERRAAYFDGAIGD